MIVMYGPPKPANDTVYMKLESVMPPGIVGVQFGLGHVCCARNWSSVGAVAVSEGTVSLPFFGESWRPGLVALAGRRAARFKIGRHVLFGESGVRAWVKAHGVPAGPAAGRREDADRGMGW